MASTNPEVIVEQPQVRSNTSRSSNTEQQLDEDGVVILFEGKCNEEDLMLVAIRVYTCSYNNDSINLICCLGAPVFLPIGIYNGCRSSKIWRLYLTHTSIFYTKANPTCVWCGTTTIEIPLSDIEDIGVKTGTCLLYTSDAADE